MWSREGGERAVIQLAIGEGERNGDKGMKEVDGG